MESLNYREEDGEILPPFGPNYEIKSDQEDDYLYYEAIYQDDENQKQYEQMSVDLSIRREALLRAIDMYSQAASHGHFAKKAQIEPQYNGLMNHFKNYSFEDEKRTLAPAIGVDAEAWVANELPADDDLIALTALIEIRKAIGKSVGAKKRNEFKKNLNRR